jgi:hypothetical protein
MENIYSFPINCANESQWTKNKTHGQPSTFKQAKTNGRRQAHQPMVFWFAELLKKFCKFNISLNYRNNQII